MMMPQDPNSMHHQQGMMPPGEVNMDNEDLNNGSSSNVNEKPEPSKSKDKRERLSRACVACHTGKTRCSDSLPCQSCIKRGIASSCAYPDPLENAQAHEGAASTSRRRSNNTQAQQQAQQQQQQQQQQSVIQPPSPYNQNPHVRGMYFESNMAAVPPGSGGPAGYNVPTTGPNGAVMAPPSAAAAAVAAAAGAITNIRREPSPPSGRPTKKARVRPLTDQEVSSFYKRGTFYVGSSAPVAIDPRLPLRLYLADDQRVDFFVGDGPNVPSVP